MAASMDRLHALLQVFVLIIGQSHASDVARLADGEVCTEARRGVPCGIGFPLSMGANELHACSVITSAGPPPCWLL